MWSSTLLCPQTQQKKIFPDIPDIPTSDNIVLAFQKKKERQYFFRARPSHTQNCP
jgi:hypothetical protein